jgi:hypothetical protein
MLPSEGDIWCSLAKTDRAMTTEYREPRCIVRELSAWEGESWGHLVNDSYFRLTIHGSEQSFMGRRVDVDDPGGLVRFYFDDVPRSSERQGVTIRSKFFVSSRLPCFPVKMSTYYCLGHTTINFEMNCKEAPLLHTFASFFDLRPHEGVVAQPPEYKNTSHVESELDALLLPGSGVYFVWDFDR